MLVSYLASGLAIIAFSCLASAHSDHVNYTVVPGIFLQDDPSTNASTFNFTASNFGLIDRDYPTDSSCPDRKHSTQWQRLSHYISALNSHSRSNERYSLLFLGRHGEGFHNAAESFYGTPAWNCYWSELDGNGTATWADAHLTATGINQALTVNKFWKHLMQDEKITPPETYYTSPLYRCLSTANLTFSGLDLPRRNQFVPTIKEYFREGISAHTCDRRSNKTFIHSNFPSYRFEKGFPEYDPYWTALHAETSTDQDIRSKKVLDDVFSNDDSTYISVTAHSGEIASLLRVLGHRTFSLSTGAVLPVFVKVTTLQGNSPTTTTQAFTSVSTCATAPTIRASTCNDCSCCK
ncbi:phosphoglycerate mutase-like protein [Lindgomyces ingoldianus]|uniref:Phosphoglycerate mutase-like protein n=1 Tax=Lindgomyces ingoldianus TaxID=673940 RepID=A0ACB6REN4_9PLEO|nr:phosphoglycerate mutase-like protein [Lindgomyces ingoldianus]KAF2476780.1 phosphoglycerate mutase-like protein [Lindgomyces ingoldianus]